MIIHGFVKGVTTVVGKIRNEESLNKVCGRGNDEEEEAKYLVTLTMLSI